MRAWIHQTKLHNVAYDAKSHLFQWEQPNKTKQSQIPGQKVFIICGSVKNGMYFDSASTQLLRAFDTIINKSFQVTLQSTSEVFEHCRTARQDHVLDPQHSNEDTITQRNTHRPD